MPCVYAHVGGKRTPRVPCFSLSGSLSSISAVLECPQALEFVEMAHEGHSYWHGGDVQVLVRSIRAVPQSFWCACAARNPATPVHLHHCIDLHCESHLTFQPRQCSLVCDGKWMIPRKKWLSLYVCTLFFDVLSGDRDVWVKKGCAGAVVVVVVACGGA